MTPLPKAADRRSLRRRLDAELVRRHLAGSRAHAGDLIREGRVRVNGLPVGAPDSRVDSDCSLVVVTGDGDPRPASRAAAKLESALVGFALNVTGLKALDAGASTGGFTDVLLRHGVSAVIAVDVGYGQLDWRLRADPRVSVRDRCNVRTLTARDLPWCPDLIVADLSFISLTLVLPVLTDLVAPAGQMVLLVKPQFEVGRAGVGKGGIVRDPAVQRAAVNRVADAAGDLGWQIGGVLPAAVTGAGGNQEYLLWLSTRTQVAAGHA